MNRPPRQFDAAGVFETCRVRKGAVLHRQEHLERLRESLRTLGMDVHRVQGVEARLNAAARRVGDGFVRIGLRAEGEPRMVVDERRGTPYSDRMRTEGVKVVTAAGCWPSGETGFAGAKHTDRLSSILARAQAGDAAEVLRFNAEGYLTEGTVSNLFLVKDGTLLTPATWLGVLDGVTRRQLLLAAGRLHIPVQETVVTRHELFNADEAFLTNVLMGVLPVREADGRRIGRRLPGPMTQRLSESLERRK